VPGCVIVGWGPVDICVDICVDVCADVCADIGAADICFDVEWDAPPGTGQDAGA
jgi:hypothetical protein